MQYTFPAILYDNVHINTKSKHIESLYYNINSYILTLEITFTQQSNRFLVFLSNKYTTKSRNNTFEFARLWHFSLTAVTRNCQKFVAIFLYCWLFLATLHRTFSTWNSPTRRSQSRKTKQVIWGQELTAINSRQSHILYVKVTSQFKGCASHWTGDKI